MASTLQLLDAPAASAAGLAAGGVAAGEPPRAAAAPAPVTGWRRLLADWMVVGGATAVCQVLGAASSLLLRMLLDPAQMGVWQAVKLFLSYANYANLGISKGATREFTIALGRGELAEARRGLDLAFTVNALSSFVYAAVLVAAGLWIGLSAGGDWAGAWAAGLVAAGAMAALSRYVTFHVTILRAGQDFASTSQLSILEAALTLGICGLATWQWGLWGLYGGTLAVLLAGTAFVWRRRMVTLAWAWDRRQIARLVAIGAPILLAGTVFSLFRSLDKLMILAYLSDREFQLGCYSAALMVSSQLYGLGNMLSIVIGPRFGEAYGRSGDRGDVARLAARTAELCAAAIVLPAALAMVAGPPLLARLLPDYQLGLAPVAWLVPGVVALCIALPASQYLVAVDQQNRALGAVLAATALGAAGNHIALMGGFGLVGVAAATAAGYVAYAVITVAISIWPALDRAGRVRYPTMLALMLLPTIALAAVLEQIEPGVEAGLSATLAKSLAVVLVWGLTALVGWRYGRWGEALAAKQRSTPHHTGPICSDCR